MEAELGVDEGTRLRLQRGPINLKCAVGKRMKGASGGFLHGERTRLACIFRRPRRKDTSDTGDLRDRNERQPA